MATLDTFGSITVNRKTVRDGWNYRLTLQHRAGHVIPERFAGDYSVHDREDNAAEAIAVRRLQMETGATEDEVRARIITHEVRDHLTIVQVRVSG